MDANQEFALFANGLYTSLVNKYYDPLVYENELFGLTLERIRYDVRWSGATLVDDWATGDAKTQGVLLALTERCQAEGHLLVEFLDVHAIPTLPVLLGWHSVGTAPGLTEAEEAELHAFNAETKALNRIFRILDTVGGGKVIPSAAHREVMKEINALNKRLGEEIIKIEEIPFESKVNDLECDEATSPIECELTSRSAANSPE